MMSIFTCARESVRLESFGSHKFFSKRCFSQAVLFSSVAFGVVSTAWADQSAELAAWLEQNANATKNTPAEVASMEAPGPNPWLSVRPAEATVDWSYWNTQSASLAAVKAASMPPANVRVQAKKRKGVDTQMIRGFGTNPAEVDELDVDGVSAPPPIAPLIPNAEDEGSIILATPTNLVSGNAVKASATIGDGPFGSAAAGSGDFDFFMIPAVKAGDLIEVDIDTPVPFGPLDSFVALYDAAGVLVAFNDDDGSSFDSSLSFTAITDGDYYVSVGGFGSFSLDDPFDSASGTGAASEGIYDVTIGLIAQDTLYLTFKLRKGDIFGASLAGIEGRLTLVDKGSLERQGSARDATFIHPDASPLPSGLAALSHTADRTGDFILEVSPFADGNYTVALRVFKNPLLSGVKGDVQTVFLDFDGETIDVGALFSGLPPGVFVRNLSPLVDFLPGWGLTAADEDAVIDAIIVNVRESLVDDIKRSGREPMFDIKILNSRDHADPFGDANVSRIIVGGTIPELGIGTIGIAESIDVGNFETNETAVVLLDLLSAPAGNPNSLNSFPLAPGASIIDLIGTGVGNITAHEAGHYLGNWHTDQFNEIANLMDQGGNLANSVGVGPDGIFGTADDKDVDFGLDIFVQNEGFTGIEDTLNSIAIGDPAPRSRR